MQKIDVEFLCVYKPHYEAICKEFAQSLIDSGIKVHFVKTSSYIHPRLIFVLKNRIKKGSFDIVHSHLIYADFWMALLKSIFKLKAITVSTLHGYQEEIYTKFCLTPKKVPKNRYYKIAKFSYKKLDHVYACSAGLKDFFVRIGIKTKAPITVIHHGFEYPFVENNLDREKFLCVIVGRLIPRKGHDLVLEKCVWLKENVPNFNLNIVGDGELFETLKQKIDILAMNSFVHLIGYTPTPQNEMAKADLVLVPSYAEGLPLVIFEAMSLAKPVIAFKTIGPTEAIIDGETGYLIEPFNQDKFSDKIVQLATDKSLRLKMGINGKELVNSRFSLHRMTEDTISFYQMCLNSRPFLTI